MKVCIYVCDGIVIANDDDDDDGGKEKVQNSGDRSFQRRGAVMDKAHLENMMRCGWGGSRKGETGG